MPEDLAAGPVGLGTVWFLGLSMGMTACTVTCLPFIGTWALGRASGRIEAFAHTGVFLLGRVVIYALLAALAGALGAGLAKSLGGALGNAVIGATSVFAGAWLLARPSGRTCGTPASAAPRVARLRRFPYRDALPPLALGAALSLTPCSPLASLLVLAAHAGSAPQGAAYGLAFGLGTAVTPILVLVPLAGRLGREMRAGRAWLSRWLVWGAAAVLIVLGLRRLLILLP